MTHNEPLIQVTDLKKWYTVTDRFLSVKQHQVKAVNGVSFSVNAGETLGIVGETGCGKTTLGRTILRLVEPTSGEIRFMGEDLLACNKTQLRSFRRKLGIIFQDPYGSLDPRMKVGDIIGEPLVIQKLFKTSNQRKARVFELLDIVGLDSDYYWRYAHEFSGGQRQRIGIARTLATNPALIVCDEPVSALDASIQAQILNLLESIRKRSQVTYIFISHDLSVVKHVSDNVAVMYLGKIVEIAPKDRLYENAAHPYTKALLSAIPIPDTTVKRQRILLHGDIPNPINIPSGCCFRTRCPHAGNICAEVVPELKRRSDGHFYACHL